MKEATESVNDGNNLITVTVIKSIFIEMFKQPETKL